MEFHKKDIQTALIDADIMLYRAAWKHEGGDIEEAYETIDAMFDHIFHVTGCSSYIGFLTGRNNFRKKIATTKVYKGNRKDMVMPVHLDELRDYLINQWECDVVNGLEADDALGICQTEMQNTIICSIDKDLLQIKGLHYNWNKSEFFNVTEYDGWQKLYEQTLSGDSTDNIVGIPRVGEKKAKKILAECFSEEDAVNCSIFAYKNYYNEDEGLALDMYKENFNLVKICTSSKDERLDSEFLIPEVKYVF
ncbi:5'-3' exonuclease [uncultured Mediterranean phage uvMED]|nr:5'-3' exonuclease [uncultured Mediterranean phage uvMED]